MDRNKIAQIEKKFWIATIFNAIFLITGLVLFWAQDEFSNIGYCCMCLSLIWTGAVTYYENKIEDAQHEFEFEEICQRIEKTHGNRNNNN